MAPTATHNESPSGRTDRATVNALYPRYCRDFPEVQGSARLAAAPEAPTAAIERGVGISVP